MKRDKTVPVYCTETPKKTLMGYGVAEERFKAVRPDEVIQIGNYTIRPRRFRHIVFDPLYILSVVPQSALMLPRLFRLASLNRKMPENGEIVAYEIEAEGKKIFLTGSFREYPGEVYPDDIDLLILANGGSIFVPEKTKAFIDRYKPGKIMVDHFDNAFPPVTRTVSVERLKKMTKKNHPEIEFIIPEFRKSFEL